ncbi:hypothetical protein RFI_24617 [Reticulomyxa filosa]|uniref:Uncharacterized protein n=1 Tax=Reticulomyxa filosa TaxID=46433 RepID=X6MFG1_RETFI|nr:hypothetical protein RFI_24617 [Reticulomyxa filosa]|eukprot:ETO12758.1 hypothetical protein RFI_24617 [Reticulomyxa filosa]
MVDCLFLSLNTQTSIYSGIGKSTKLLCETLQLVYEKLPKIQYITFMEQYTFCCFLFLFSVTAWSCIAGAFSSIGQYDNTAFLSFLSFFVFFQGFSIVRAYFSRRWEREKLTKSGDELKKYIEKRLCCKLWCLRRDQKKILFTQWDRKDFFGEKKEKQTEAIIRGESIPEDLIANEPNRLLCCKNCFCHRFV